MSRYELCAGPGGPSFRDNVDNREVSMSDVLALLNEADNRLLVMSLEEVISYKL